MWMYCAETIFFFTNNYLDDFNFHLFRYSNQNHFNTFLLIFETCVTSRPVNSFHLMSFLMCPYRSAVDYDSSPRTSEDSHSNSRQSFLKIVEQNEVVDKILT